MKLKFFLIVVMLFLIVGNLSIVSAAEVTAEYKILDEKILVEINFVSVTNLELEIPYDAELIELDIESSLYTIVDEYYYQLLKVDSAENLKIQYTTTSYLDKSGKTYFFILDIPFNVPSDITLSLPEAAVLDESIAVFPKQDEITSDGRRIILKWQNQNPEQILVSYEFLNESNLGYYIIILVLMIGFVIWDQLRKRKFRIGKKNKKEESELTRNLFEDEKRIVKYLLEKKSHEAWTKEIIRNLNISKVKLSRKIRSLEEKKIIKRIPYGNENIIRLLG